jgi:3-hydroxyisobutyrate dehydrogenase-like beta-hydroxyacid dehydrogenase
MLGEDGALRSLAAGAAWIDMSSSSPTAFMARPGTGHEAGSGGP